MYVYFHHDVGGVNVIDVTRHRAVVDVMVNGDSSLFMVSILFILLFELYFLYLC